MKLILLAVLLVMIVVVSVVVVRRRREQAGLSAPGLYALSGRRDDGSAFQTCQRTYEAPPVLSRLHRILMAADPRHRNSCSWSNGNERKSTAARRSSQARVRAAPHGLSRTCAYWRRMFRRCRSRPVIALRPANASIGASTIGVGLSDSIRDRRPRDLLLAAH